MNANNEFILPANPLAGYLSNKVEIDAAICRVLESGLYILANEVEEFEREFASFIGSRYGIAVANGTDAIEIALRAAVIGAGDLVFSVSHTAVATLSAIERTGATPVLVDIDPVTYTMDAGCLKKTLAAIASQKQKNAGTPRAIIPVHLYGHPANMPAILEIANKYDMVVIEDCAQAHGAKLHGKIVGTFGHMAAFSFYPTKNLGAIGDGGFVTTNSDYYRKKILMLRQYGWEQRYISSIAGINSRLDELQAAILRVKLKYLSRNNERRRHIAKKYNAILQGISPKPPIESKNAYHVYHQYVIKTDKRDVYIEHFKKRNIGTSILYPVPIHLQPAYKGRILTGLDGLVETERACLEILSLPIYPELSDEQVDRIADALQTVE